MTDFLINEKGDLVILKEEAPSRFKLGFRLSENVDFRLLFHIGEQRDFKEDAQMKLSFSMGRKDERSRFSTVEDKDTKAQMIKMALMTEQGEIKALERYGSKIYLYKNENMFSSEVMRKIESSVKEAIGHISPEAVVKAKPEIGSGNFYAQTIGVYIYESDRLILRFRI